MVNILFRAKGKNGEGWQEGYYWYCQDTILCCATKEEWEANEHYYILFSGFCDWNMPRPHYKMEIIPETLGLFSTFHDLNKIKIFHGDIIDFVINHDGGDTTYRGIIKFTGDTFVVCESIHSDKQFALTDVIAHAQVIGNQWDNPKLLK